MSETACRSVIVSPELTHLLGCGDVHGVTLPPNPALVVFGFDGTATVRIAADALAEPLGSPDEGETSVSIVIDRAALERVFGWSPETLDGERFHLTSDLRAIALRLRDCPLGGESA